MTSPSTSLRELAPLSVQRTARDRSIALADIREPQENAAERIHSALLFPLSAFDSAALSSPDGCEVIFQRGTGKRSAMAAARCLKQGNAHATHMAGGIQAWKAMSLATVSLDPAGGGFVDHR